LTSQQRSQLFRTTQQLGKVMGTTPALLEATEPMPSKLPLNLQRLAVPLHIQLSSTYTDDDALFRYPSSDTSASDYDTPSYLKRTPSRSSQKSGRSSIDSANSVYCNESWPRSQADQPFLRIAVPPPSKLHSIPQSPPANGPPPPAYSVDGPHPSFTIRPVPASRMPPASSPGAPAFVIPSANSLRRQKMDRLRRKLGDGVPLDLVFPDEETHPVPMLHSASWASSDEDVSSQRAARPPPHRIRAARNPPHAARLAPPPPPVKAPSPTPRAAKKLSIIAEHEEACPPSPSDRGPKDSERYEGDTEAEFAQTHRRSLCVYEQPRFIKRVPVPAA
ncbi:hypothetical protein GGX14DRAFT_431907, partial [Mycena pura]